MDAFRGNSIDDRSVDWHRVVTARYSVEQTLRYEYESPIVNLHHQLIITPRRLHLDQERLANHLWATGLGPLSLEEIAEIEASTKERIDLGVVDKAGLSKEDRLFVYAVACWIARMDGEIKAEESEVLAKLGERLGVPERPRMHAEAIAREVAEMPEGDRPARYDLIALRRILTERLRDARAAKQQQPS